MTSNSGDYTQDGTMNIVKYASSLLTDEVRNRLVEAALRKIAKDAIRKHADGEPMRAMGAAAEALQRKMETEAAQEFAREVYKHTTIDARKPIPGRESFACDTAQDWAMWHSAIGGRQAPEKRSKNTDWA